uniref:Uncharacterized protein n=1 Tax=Zea mays TaxID=4577 RepID=A0A804QM12_MAIZE
MLVDLYDTGLDEFIFNLVTQDKESRDLNNEEKIEVAGKEKQEWNALFKLDKYARASKRYEKYIEYDSSFSEDEKKQSKQPKFSCNLNNAACKLKLKDYKEAAKLCTKVLELDSKAV